MKVGIGYSQEQDAFTAGKKGAEDAIKKGTVSRPDCAFAFCSAKVDPDDFFMGVQSVIGDKTPITGGSAIGVITNNELSYEGFATAVAVIESDRLRFQVTVVDGLDKSEKLAGKRLAETITDRTEGSALLILYDSIKIPATEGSPPVLNASMPLISGLEQGLQANIPVWGAGLVRDYDFIHPIRQFCGTYVDSQSVVGVLFSGLFTPYFRIMHGCSPLDGVYHKVTKIEGSTLYELDGKPVVEMIDDLYGNQDWRHRYPVDLLTIGVNYGKKFEEPEEAMYVNRLITGALPDGSGISIFEPDLEYGSEIQFMLRDSSRMIDSARENASELMDQIKADGKKAAFGLYIDCAGRAAGFSNMTREEAREIMDVLSQHQTPLLGFYSGVEIAPFLQKSRGLDWTGVLLVLAE